MRCLTTWSTPLLNLYLDLYKKDLKILLTPSLSADCLSKRQIAAFWEEVRLHRDMILLIEAILASRA